MKKKTQFSQFCKTKVVINEHSHCCINDLVIRGDRNSGTAKISQSLFQLCILQLSP